MFAIEMVYLNAKGQERQRRTSGGDAAAATVAAAAAAAVDWQTVVRATSPAPPNRRRLRGTAVN